MFMPVSIYEYGMVDMQEYTCIWGSEENLMHHSSDMIHHFETRSLTSLEVTKGAGWPVIPKDPTLVSAILAQGLQACGVV